MNKKLEIAIEFLKNGQSFTVDDLRLEIVDGNSFVVTGWSRYLNFSSLNKEKSIEELSEIKTVFSSMLETSNNLKDFISDKSIEYKLCFDDGGKASIDICSEKHGILKWLTELK